MKYKYINNYNEISTEMKMKITKSFVSPRPIAWVLTQGENAYNLAPFSYFNAVTEDVLSLSVLRNHQEHKDTAKNLVLNSKAMIHIPVEEDFDHLDDTGKPFDYDVSEVKALGIELEINPDFSMPHLKNSNAYFEVNVIEHLEVLSRNGQEVSSDLFLLQIDKAYIDEKYWNGDRIKVENLNLLSRLGGPFYGLTKIFKQTKL